METRNSVQGRGITVKVLKEHHEIFGKTFAIKFMMQFLLENFRHFTSKVTKAAPIFKSIFRHQKENHRPIYIHQWQNLMFTQLSNCSHNFRLCATLSVFDDRKMEKALDVMQILGQLGYSTRCNSRLCFGTTFVKCFFFVWLFS